MKITLSVLSLLILGTYLGCGNTVSPECEKYVQTHACGKSNLPQKSQQDINDSCLALSVEQREAVISCVEQSSYCDLYNAYKIDDAIKISIACYNKIKSSN